MSLAKSKAGFSLAEIILSIAVFSLVGTIIISAFIYGRQATQQAGDRARAAELTNETMEAVRNIANPSYSNLGNYSNGTTYYLTTAGNQWQLSTVPNTVDGIYTRTVVFADGPNGSRQVTATVTWQISPSRNGTVNATTYLANWRQPTSSPSKSGLFVYANGGLTSDQIGYRQLLTDGTWTAASQLPDVDTGSTNRVPRSLKLYSAQTGSAKMVLSRHYNGTTQYLYATYWNGTSFGQPQLLAQWNSSTALNSGNYGGDYLANGSFVAVYSDGSNTPKSRIFNGINWGPQTSLGAIGTSSNYLTAMMIRARPNSNDMMVILLTSDSSVNTSFYTNNAWSGYTQQTPNSIGNGSLLVDYDWSNVDPTHGMALYTNSPNDRSLRGRTFTVDGTGSGSWAPVTNASNIPAGRAIASLRGTARPNTADEFIGCVKDDVNPSAIYCYEIAPGSSGFITPSNNVVTSNTVPGVQITFDVAYKYQNSNDGIVAYSDNTRSGKLKIYDSANNSWAVNPIALPNAASTIEKTRVVGRPNSNEAMVIVADANTDLYSVVLNGDNNTLYSAPSGKAWTVHTTNGPSNNAVWYDFAWDN